jgi:GTP cyclohydrolase I
LKDDDGERNRARRHGVARAGASRAALIHRECIMSDTSSNRKRGARSARADGATPKASVTDVASPPARGVRARHVADGEALPREDWGMDLDPAPARNPELEAVVRDMLALLGEDPLREGLAKTPQRVANSMLWLTRGYEQDARDVIGDALFEETHENMVIVRDIELYSLCEHHLLPFFGKAHIAYIPNGHIVGLSKLPRVVEVFARRLQVQERLTDQIADALEEVLQPLGVGVVIEAAHLCMMMRGVEKQNSKTITSAMRGTFRSDLRTREEFLMLTHASQGLLGR